MNSLKAANWAPFDSGVSGQIMTEAWVDLVPESVRSRCLSLMPFGVHETAWPIACADSVIPALHNGGYAIFGGDIYIKEAATFAPAYENWSCSVAPGEHWHTYVKRSYIEASRYLLGHHLKSDQWFTIVATSKPDATQLVMSHAR